MSSDFGLSIAYERLVMNGITPCDFISGLCDLLFYLIRVSACFIFLLLCACVF